MLCLPLVFLSSCKKPQDRAGENASGQSLPPNSIELVFTYGSEKEKWIQEVTEAFNRSAKKTGSGKQIVVTAIPMGSGD